MVKNYDGEIKQLLVRLIALDGNNGVTYIGQIPESKRGEGERGITIRDYVMVETCRLLPQGYRNNVIATWFKCEREPNTVVLESLTGMHPMELDDWDRAPNELKEIIRKAYTEKGKK